MNGENDRIKRIEEFLLDPEKALFTTIEEFRSAINQILPVITAIDFAKLETLKGEDGKTPQRGVDYMTQEDIDALEAFILTKVPRADVDYASIEATEAFIKAQIAKIPRVKGDQGERGKAGKDGKDGSPDTGADILKKLRTLGRNQGLQIDDIRGLENRIKIYNTAVDDLARLREEFDNQRIVIPANMGGGSGATAVESITAGTGIAVDSTLPAAPVVALSAGSIASLALADTSVQPGDNVSTLVNDAGYLTNITGKISQGTNITITGTGTSGDPYVINASGGASGDVVGPASSVDNRVVFFDGVTGKLIKDSGLTLSGSNTGDQTSIVGISGTKAEFDTALSDGNFLYVGDVTQYTDEMAQDAVGAMISTAFTYTDGTPLLALTSRTIGGVAYDGTANITVATATGGFTVSGGDLAIGANNLTLTGSIGATGARATKVWATDIESTNMPTVGGTSLSSTFAALAGSTSQAFSVSTLDVGNADTTISRGAAGFIAVEGNRVPSPASQASGDILYRGATEWERLAKGTAGQVLTMNSGATAPEWATAGGAPNVQTFNASGTWNKPASGTMAFVQIWGGGGGSGGGDGFNTNNSPGGGGGGYVEFWIALSLLGSTETVTIGAGGAAGGQAQNAGSNGGNGGNSSFGSWATGFGGGGAESYWNGTAHGGYGGGVWTASTVTVPGSPLGSTSLDSTMGGAGPGKNSVWGGAGGGDASTAGGKSVQGGGGGGGGGASPGAAGNSIAGGDGGAGASNNSCNAGAQPGGGAGGGRFTSGQGTGAAGGAGRVRVTVI